MVPIAKEFDVPLAEVAFVLTITLWMRLVRCRSTSSTAPSMRALGPAHQFELEHPVKG
jgi:hypothetical protein